MINYLVIVEGEKTESKILLSILSKYDINPIKVENRLNKDFEGFDFTKSTDGKVNVYIIQGPMNNITQLPKYYNSNLDSYNNIFENSTEIFAGIYLLYDCDHSKPENLLSVFDKFNDQTDKGLLLLSCPCIEVLADEDFKQLDGSTFKTYKSQLNTKCINKSNLSLEEYIISNFNNLIIKFLEKNKDDYNETNILEHPSLIITKHMKENVIDSVDGKQHHIINYFTTVIYVMIAQIKGLTKKIDNYEIVYNYFFNIK